MQARVREEAHGYPLQPGVGHSGPQILAHVRQEKVHGKSLQLNQYQKRIIR